MDKYDKRLAAFVAVGFLYFLWISATGICVPCLFRTFTGLKCPGCGMTTMCVNMIRGNLPAAFEANRFIFVTLPLLIAEFAYIYILRKREEQIPKWNSLIVIIYCAALMMFGIVRNLAGL